jgi:hypothetical protein
VRLPDLTLVGKTNSAVRGRDSGILKFHSRKEIGMPMYQVWYRDIPEPLAFTTASRCSEEEIVQHVLAHEGMAEPAGAASAATPASELIVRNHLAPVRYTEDESEMNMIGEDAAGKVSPVAVDPGN